MSARALADGIADVADGIIRYEVEIERLRAFNAELVTATEDLVELVKDLKASQAFDYPEIRKARSVIAKVKGEA